MLFNTIALLLAHYIPTCLVVRPDGVNTVTIDEKERYEEIKERLKDFLANQITKFRHVLFDDILASLLLFWLREFHASATVFC